MEIEQSANPIPPLRRLRLDLPRFDQSTFAGRLQHFYAITDMRKMLVSSEELKHAQTLIQSYEQAGCPPISREEEEVLWRAKNTVDAIVHPQTMEAIPLPFRLSSFVPLNVVICAGMLWPNPSMATLVFWQWVNQSYNIALNHANRNASNELSTQKIAMSYGSAVAISCSLAVGMSQWVKRAKFSPSMRAVMTRAVPFTAVAAAGVANVVLMRSNEMTEGISVHSEDGKDVGKSKTAGQIALAATAVSRIGISAVALVAPPVGMALLERTGMFRSGNMWVRQGATLAVIGTTLMLGMPAAIALFPQHLKVSPKLLEPEFANKTNKSGQPLQTVVINKGL